MQKRYVGEYAACPFYLIIFLPWTGVEFPFAWETEEVPRWLIDDDFFSKRLLPLRFVPSIQADQTAALEAAVAAQPDGQPLCLGTLKQKKPDKRWNISHIHQVIVWVGSSRTGKWAHEQRNKKSCKTGKIGRHSDRRRGDTTRPQLRRNHMHVLCSCGETKAAVAATCEITRKPQSRRICLRLPRERRMPVSRL